MTTAYGVNNTLYRTGGGANVIDRAQLKGGTSYIIDTYEASALADGSTIAIGVPLNAGDVILGGDLYFDALGSATISVGDVNTAALYLTATSVSSAGHATFDKVNGHGYVVGTAANDEIILLTTASAATTGTIKCVVYVGRV